MNFLITSLRSIIFVFHTSGKNLEANILRQTRIIHRPNSSAMYWMAPITIKNKLHFKNFKYAFAEVVMQLCIYLFIHSFIYSPTSTMGAGNNLRGCLSQVIVILLMQPPDLQLCVCLLFTPLLRFYLPTWRFSLVLQYHPAGSPTPLHTLSSLVMTKGKKDTMTGVSRKDVPTSL